jgi:hypothetical protein
MRRYKPVRAMLNGVTHSALEDADRSVIAGCGTPCGLATIYDTGVLQANVPEIDCMACIAAACR